MEEKNVRPLLPFYGGAAFSINVIFYLVFFLILTGITALIPSEGVSGYILRFASPLAVAATSAVFFKVTRLPVKEILPVKTKPKYYLIGLLLIFGLLFSLNSLNDLLVKLFELMGYTRKQPDLPDFSGWNILPALIVIAIIPAVAEEILFRGIALNSTENDTGSVLSIVFVGLCFALYHGSVEQTVYQFICGCLFALLAVRSRSVLPSTVIHFLNNAVIIILCACGCTDMTTGALVMPSAVKITLTVLSAVSLVGAVVWLVLDKTELKKRREGGVKKFFIGASVGIAVMVIMWIANLFV